MLKAKELYFLLNNRIYNKLFINILKNILNIGINQAFFTSIIFQEILLYNKEF